LSQINDALAGERGVRLLEEEVLAFSMYAVAKKERRINSGRSAKSCGLSAPMQEKGGEKKKEKMNVATKNVHV